MKKSGCAILALCALVCVSMFGNLILLAAIGAKGVGGTRAGSVKVLNSRPFEEEIVVNGSSTSQKVVIIPLQGVIAFGAPGSLGDSQIEDFKQALEQAANDSEVTAVIISTDSPGGEITASDVLYHELHKFSQRKPVIVYFNSIGASGAYYAACGASWIMCNDTTFTGSIGVIISTLNYRELFGKIGLQSIVFKSGKFKDMLSGTREMTPEESAYVEGLVMQSYGRFVGIVAKARKLDEQALRNGVADGRILSGTDAFQEKLIDQLGYIEDAYAKARDMGKSPDAQIVRYKRTYSFENFFRMLGESSTKTPEVKFDLLQGMNKLEPGRVYLLPPFFAP